MIPTFPTRKPTDASSRRAAACPPSSVPNSGQIRDATLVGVRANDVSESEHSRDQGEGDQIGESTTHVPRIRRSPGPCQGLEYPRVPHQPSSAPSACGATRRASAWRFSACHGRRRRRVISRTSRSCRCVDIVPSSQLPAACRRAPPGASDSPRRRLDEPDRQRLSPPCCPLPLAPRHR